MTARDEAAALVAAGFCLGRVVPVDEAELARRIGPWVLATIAERFTLPPVGVVADLGGLLFGMPLRTSAPVPTDDAALQTALRRYEDALLGRLAVDGRLVSAGYAIARLPVELHAQAVGILVASVLARVEASERGDDAAVAATVEIGPGVVRELTERGAAATLVRGYATLRDDAAVRARLTAGYVALARGAQKARHLIGDEDLFALENLAVLRTLTQRLAIADVLRAEEAISAGIPPRVARRRRREGDIASQLEDESVYPVGGFASVSTTGSLENLVTSELIYMDPPPQDGPAPVDLFDMRYVEGELLYYTRDEAIIVRRRRVVILALAADLVRSRVKDVGVPWQRIVLVLGAVLALTKKLGALLGEEALTIRVVFVTTHAGSASPLAEESALTALMLREWAERGIVDVTAAPWDEIVASAAAASQRALVGLVLFHALPFEATLDRRIAFTAVDVGALPVEAWSRNVSLVLAALL